MFEELVRSILIAVAKEKSPMPDPNLDWFTHDRFGLFVHGVCTHWVPATNG